MFLLSVSCLVASELNDLVAFAHACLTRSREGPFRPGSLGKRLLIFIRGFSSSVAMTMKDRVLFPFKATGDDTQNTRQPCQRGHQPAAADARGPGAAVLAGRAAAWGPHCRETPSFYFPAVGSSVRP